MKKLEKIVTVLGIVAVGLATLFGTIKIISIYTQKQIPTAEVQAYLEQIGPMGQKISDVMVSVTPLFTNAINVSQQDALKQIGAAKEKLIVIGEEAKAYTPPASLVSAHDRFKQAVGNYVDSFKLTEIALQQNDPDKSKQAADLLIKGSDGLKQISDEIAVMKEKK